MLFAALSPALAFAQDAAAPAVNQADTAWMLISTALVLLMTPALGFFYGGLVRSKNSLNTMMMSYIALGFVGVAWALIVFSLAFAPGNDYVGDLSLALLRNVGLGAQSAAALIPQVLFMSYQGTFAIITAALISGAIVERMRFTAYTLFITLWAVLIYGPIAHWVWGGGWLAKMGALDFAGGTVVHVNAGVAALVAAMVIGSRKDFARQAILPAQRPVHAARRRPPVVRMVRLQCRKRSSGQPDCGPGVHHHLPRADGYAGRLDAARSPSQR
jgi:Amt family ammonium transporter